LEGSGPGHVAGAGALRRRPAGVARLQPRPRPKPRPQWRRPSGLGGSGRRVSLLGYGREVSCPSPGRRRRRHRHVVDAGAGKRAGVTGKRAGLTFFCSQFVHDDTVGKLCRYDSGILEVIIPGSGERC
jgi:hypothetical protein